MRHVGQLIRAALIAALAAAALLPGPAAAATGGDALGEVLDTTSPGESASDLTYVPSGLPDTPSGYGVSALRALEAADADPKVVARKAELAGDEELTATVTAEGGLVWEVGYFLAEDKVNLVVVDGRTGEVEESWTGSAVDWPMARGREGQFGHILNAPWVWLPLAGVFLIGLWDFRRWRKWVHLDLLVLLSFGVSQAFFNAAEIGLSVPLAYPPLLYLLARMVWIGFRGAERASGSREGLRPSLPVWVLAGLTAGLIALRIVANVVDSGVIDVGYAGMIGADKITDAQPIYGEGSFPQDNGTGDTYGPASYFAYVPFEAALPWSGSWDELPAAHAAAIFFDLATVVGLFLLGRLLVRRRQPQPVAAAWDGASASGRSRLARLRPRLPSPTPENSAGLMLSFAWVAYPYSTFALQSNSNDALISALLVWSLVAFASPVARGGLLALASMAKFAPLVLAPLYATGERGIPLRDATGRRRMLRPIALFAAAFLLGTALLLAHPAVDPGLATFYERTLASQLERTSPFSIWGQADLEWLQTALKAAAIALAALVAFVPRRRSLAQIAALAAAVIIALELTLEHWFYLYIPWFLPMLLAALAARAPAAEDALPSSRSRARQPLTLT